MGFTIRCHQCGNEVELHQADTINLIGRNDEGIFSHTNGIACDCGNRVHNNLTKEFFFQVNHCDPRIKDYLIRLQNYTVHLDGYEAVWVRGCLSRSLGVIDSALTIIDLLPVATQHLAEGYDHLAAMSKASYSYENLLSHFHDLLDNIGFIYGVKVQNKKVKETALSFFKLFYNSGKLRNPSKNERLNETLEKIYEKAAKYADRDNQYKHMYSPGLIHLYQPEEFIRNLSSIAGNCPDFLDLNAISTDTALKDTLKIKDKILYLALFCVMQLIDYNMEGASFV